MEKRDIRLIPFHDAKVGLWGYKDGNGDTVVNPVYTSCSEIDDNGIAVVQTSKGYQFVKQVGRAFERLTDELYEHVCYFKGERAAVQPIDRKWGIIDIQGNWVSSPLFDYESPFIQSKEFSLYKG